MSVATTAFFASCDSDMTEFNSFPARFVITPVTQVPQLYTAATSAGEYCMIWREGTNTVFQNQYGSSMTLSATALTSYNTWVSTLGNGFIVGTTNMPEPGNTEVSLVAYDRSCPNCYTEDYITRAMTFSSYGHVSCGRCHRTYDLNNGGYVKDSTGIKLFRYRVSYTGTTLSVSN